MDWKRKLTMATVAAATAFSLFSSAVLAAPEDTDGEGNAVEEEQAAAPEPSAAEETAVSQASGEQEAPQESSAAQKAAAQTLSPEEALELYQTKGVKYTSQRYGYSIICPKKPNVIPASLLVEGAKGDVLIFENDGYDIKNAWVVLADTFDDAELPADMGQKSEDEQKAYIDHLMNTAGYEFVRLTQVAGGTGVYAVTAKEIDVDTDGDGKPDDTMVAENQGIKTFFRGQYGGHFSVQLIDNPELSPAGVGLYQLGLLTFQEWPTAVEDGKVVQKDQDAKATNNKMDKKDKKNKK